LKAAPFEYVRPSSLAEACAILASDEDARPIAGGQTLVPMMAMRLARPGKLVDISRLPELDGIKRDDDALSIGAAVRQAVAERSSEVARHLPLLSAALPWVGHQPTRNRGTLGGSVANADPAAEIPLVLVTLGGAVRAAGPGAEREIPAREFFEGLMATALEEGEIVSSLSFPIWGEDRVGVGFHEISARKSDFAYVSAAAQVALDEQGKCTRCVIGLGAVVPSPVYLAAASEAVASGVGVDDVRGVLEAEFSSLDIMTDSHATAAYRRRAALALTSRALDDALSQAGEA